MKCRLMAKDNEMKIIRSNWTINFIQMKEQGFVEVGTLELDDDYFMKPDGSRTPSRDVINKVVNGLKNT